MIRIYFTVGYFCQCCHRRVIQGMPHCIFMLSVHNQGWTGGCLSIGWWALFYRLKSQSRKEIRSCNLCFIHGICDGKGIKQKNKKQPSYSYVESNVQKLPRNSTVKHLIWFETVSLYMTIGYLYREQEAPHAANAQHRHRATQLTHRHCIQASSEIWSAGVPKQAVREEGSTHKANNMSCIQILTHVFHLFWNDT